MSLDAARLPGLRRRITGALFVSQSLYSSATIAAFTLTPIIVSNLAGSERAAGLPSTLVLLSRAAFAYPLGLLMDRWGRRAGLTLSYFLGALGGLVSVLSIVQGSFWGFLAGAFLFGMLRGGADQSRFVAAEVQTPDREARAIGWVVFAGTIGSIGGPLLVPASSQWALSLGLPDETGPFLLSVLLFAVAMLVLFAFLRPDPLQLGRSTVAERDAGLPPQVLSPIRSLRQLWAVPSIRLAIAAMAIGQAVMTLLMVITPVHMDHNNHGQQTISWVIMAHTLGMFGLSGLTGRLVERFGRRAVILTGTGILIVSAAVAPISPNWVPLALALFLLGLGWNFCFIGGSSLLSSQLARHERGRGQGSGETMVALGASVGSLSSGFLFAAGGMITLAAVGLALCLLLAFMTIGQMRRIPAPAEVG